MPGKLAIIEHIGERGLLLPEFIARGLAANDRVKYYLSLLQAAQAHAQSLQQPYSNLRPEREASGVTDTSLDHVVEASIDRGNSLTYIPGASTILDQLFGELRRMVLALQTAGSTRLEIKERADLYQHRLDDLFTTVPACTDDQVASGTINALTSVKRNGHDTVQQLIVDLQAELTRLQAEIPEERVDGADAFALTDVDRTLVRAFMAGVNRTSALKFDHPGLATTAARDANVLSIENDLGGTESHVVVVRIEDRTATITYTDVHHSRVRFFQGMLQPHAVEWTHDAGVSGALYEMVTGRYVAETQEQLERFLTFLGSRLVFLIDWNRARKRLARLVSKNEATDILKWTAENEVGHRAFLQIGGTRLIETAFERAIPLPARFGVRLDEQLGRHAARMFLISVLRTASTGLMAGHAIRLIEDKIEAELLRYLERPEHHVIAGIAEHAGMIAAIAERTRGDFLRRRNRGGDDDADRDPAVLHTWITRADAILRQDASFTDLAGQRHEFGALLAEAAHAASSFEEAAFMLSLIPGAAVPAATSLLEGLVEQAAEAARRYVRCLEQGRQLSRSSDRADVDEFLATVDTLTAIGESAGRARRAIVGRLVSAFVDCRELYTVTEIGQGLERAAVSLARCGALVRDHVLRSRLPR